MDHLISVHILLVQHRGLLQGMDKIVASIDPAFIRGGVV